MSSNSPDLIEDLTMCIERHISMLVGGVPEVMLNPPDLPDDELAEMSESMALAAWEKRTPEEQAVLRRLAQFFIINAIETADIARAMHQDTGASA